MADRVSHTPGPWLIEYAHTGVRWPVIYVEDEAWDGGRREIAEICDSVAKRTKADRWRKTETADEANANARLIAAAPELLTFLREALPMLESMDISAEEGDAPIPFLANARALLARVEAR